MYRAIVGPFGKLLNEFSSTFSFCPELPGFSTVLAGFPRCSVPVTTNRGICKNIPFLCTFYSFWEPHSYLFHLFGMPYLVTGDHLEPFIHV